MHVLAVVCITGRPGEWVQCSCGWASPDVQFPTDAEAIEWARREHEAASVVHADPVGLIGDHDHWLACVLARETTRHTPAQQPTVAARANSLLEQLASRWRIDATCHPRQVPTI